MIVKNEERTLPRLASTLRGQIDYWTIVDTGSTDSTLELVRDLFADIPGQLIETPWRGYGPSRQVSFEAARSHTDWLFLIDADETVQGDIRLALDVSDIEAIEAETTYDIITYWGERLIVANAPWHFNGRAHEWLTLDEGEPRKTKTLAFHITHHYDGGNRGDKLERELGLLEEDYQEQPNNSRTVFYLARTHEDMGHYDRAAELYRERLELPGWDEETWYAHWRLGLSLVNGGRREEGVGTLLAAWGERPWRAEPLWSLMEHFRLQSQWRISWEMGRLAVLHTAVRPDGRGPSPATDRLFVHEDVYRWQLAYERSICAWYVGEISTGRRLTDYLLHQNLPESIRESVEGNSRFYIPGEHG